MKRLLLGGLLLNTSAAPTWAQNWTGNLPVDAADSMITYQGRVAVPGASAAVLHHRATAYMERTAAKKWVDTSDSTTRAIVGVGQQGFTHYRLVIQSTNGSFRYLLMNIEVSERAGEGFAGHRIIPMYKLTPVEAILRQEKKKPTADWQNWQTRIASTAEYAITQLLNAMK